MGIEFEILLLACLVSVACVIPGVFLVLRGLSLMSDAISHATLLGVVLTFFIVPSLDSPLLMLGATIGGVLTAILTEALIKTGKIKQDAAVGLIFPLFFSLGVILINQYAGNIHLDSDVVLFGEIALAPFNRLTHLGIDLGPIGIWKMGLITGLNAVLVFLFYKELKVSTFDAGLAASVGISPLIIHYALMCVTSLTAVAAFDSVGSILVVALMITPPATSLLLTRSLKKALIISVVLAITASVLGYELASILDVSISGSIATMTGIIFMGVLLLAPERGILSKKWDQKEKSEKFALHLLLVQLLDHEGVENDDFESSIPHMKEHMGWKESMCKSIIARGVEKGFIERQKLQLRLTELGRQYAKQKMVS